MDSLPRLLKQLEHSDYKKRCQAIDALAAIGDPRVVRPLSRCLSDEYGSVRQRAATALGSIGGPAAAAALCSAARDDDRGVRRCVAEALGQAADPSTVPTLCAMRQDAYGLVGSAALEGLRRMGVRALPELRRALGEGPDAARRGAAEVLGRLEDTGAVPLLIQALNDPDRLVRRLAALSLGQLAQNQGCIELRDALPELRRLEGFWSIEDREMKKLYRAIVDVIEHETADRKDLPRPAAAPAASVETLPVPAAHQVSAPADLPVVRDGSPAGPV